MFSCLPVPAGWNLKLLVALFSKTWKKRYFRSFSVFVVRLVVVIFNGWGNDVRAGWLFGQTLAKITNNFHPKRTGFSPQCNLVGWLFQTVGWVENGGMFGQIEEKQKRLSCKTVWLVVWVCGGCLVAVWFCGLAVWFGCVVWLCGLAVWFGCVVWLCGLVVWFGCVVGCLVAVADGWLSGRRGAGGGWSRSQDVRLSQTIRPNTWEHFWSLTDHLNQNTPPNAWEQFFVSWSFVGNVKHPHKVATPAG